MGLGYRWWARFWRWYWRRRVASWDALWERVQHWPLELRREFQADSRIARRQCARWERTCGRRGW